MTYESAISVKAVVISNAAGVEGGRSNLMTMIKYDSKGQLVSAVREEMYQKCSRD